MSDTRLAIVVGKGGVGRSTVAAGLAWEAAGTGRRVLAFDGTDDGGLERAFGGRPPPGVDLIGLDTEVSLRQYLDRYLAIPVPGLRIGPIAAAFEFLAVAAPGVREILAMGMVCHEVVTGAHDLVILDAPATGHAVELIASPDTLKELIPVGPLTSQTAWMSEMMAAASTKAIMVTLAEEVPAIETIELAQRLSEETSVTLAGVLVNRYAGKLGATARSEVKRLRERGGPVGVLAEAVRLRAKDEAGAVRLLREAGLGPLVEVPELADPAERLEAAGRRAGELL